MDRLDILELKIRKLREAEEYQSRGLHEKATEVFRSLLNIRPQLDGEDIKTRLYQQAEFYEARGRVKEALEIYERLQSMEKLSDDDEDEFNPYNDIFSREIFKSGLNYEKQKDYEAALRQFRKVLKNKELYFKALLHMAKCYKEMGNLVQARKSLLQGISHPEFPEDERLGYLALKAQIDAALGFDFDGSPEQVEKSETSKEKQVEAKKTTPEEPRTGEGIEPKISLDEPEEQQQSHPTPEIPVTQSVQGEAEFVERRNAIRAPLATQIKYSLDNKIWYPAQSRNISASGMYIELPEQGPTKQKLLVGDGILLKFKLPNSTYKEDIETFGEITRLESLYNDKGVGVGIRFLTIRADHKHALTEFVEKVLQDKEITDEIQITASEKAQRKKYSLEQPEILQAILKKLRRLEEEKEDTNQHKITFKCDCGQAFRAPASWAGRQVTCTKCGKTIQVPVKTPSQLSPDNLIGQVIGGCRIEKKIGKGGMATVFKAHHLSFDMPMAVKILHPHLAESNPNMVERFLREARAAVRLRHPNIINVMNVGEEKGIYYIVMSYVEGGSLAMLIKENGKLPPKRTFEIAIEVSKALQVAEEHGIVHRDIKPENILIDTKGNALLADLGVAKMLDTPEELSITRTGIVIGTAYYVSPEQIRYAKDIDIRSDIYSLGATMYYMLTKVHPFEGRTPFEVMQKHLTSPLTPLKEHDPTIPDVAWEVIEKMMRKKREERYQNSWELENALKSALEKIEQEEILPELDDLEETR